MADWEGKGNGSSEGPLKCGREKAGRRWQRFGSKWGIVYKYEKFGGYLNTERRDGLKRARRGTDGG